MNIPDLPGFVWFLFTAVSAGFIWMIWRLIKAMLDDIAGLRNDIKFMRLDMAKYREDNLLNCQKCVDKFDSKYRSKSEAMADWMKLSESLAEMKALAAERHKQIWEKIDNQTRLFMQEKGMLNDGIIRNGERITKLEIELSKHE